MVEDNGKPVPARVGRYLLYGPIASGGMATVHFGALVGEGGFSRTVAIKRLRADRKSVALVAGLLDEARLVSRIQHPNVVPTLDVVTTDQNDVLVVLEYVTGESLSRLLRQLDKTEAHMPLRFATTIMAGVLHGLHAAHDAKSVRGKPLGIVHRDVSPQNIIVGVDGLARVLDFGIAKAAERLSRSVAGQVKGKLGYVAPEQLKNRVDRRTDVYAAAVVLWEVLTRRRLFWGRTNGEVIEKVLEMPVPPPSHYVEGIPAELDALVLKNLSRDPEQRQATAREFALALENGFAVATSTQIGGWVQELAGEALSRRAEIVAELERDASGRSDAQLLERLGEPVRGAASPARTAREGAGARTVTDVVPTGGAAPPPASESSRKLRRATPPPAAPSDDEATTRVQDSPRVSSTPERGTADGIETTGQDARRGRLGWTTLALVAVLTGAVVFLGLRAVVQPSGSPGPDAPDSAEAPSLEPVESADPAPSVTASAPVAPDGSAAPPPPADSAVEIPLPPRTPLPSPPSPRVPADPKGPASKSTGSCDPPFTVDERGIRRLKPECM